MVFNFGKRRERKEDFDISSKALKEAGRREKVIKKFEKLVDEKDPEKLQRFIALEKKERGKARVEKFGRTGHAIGKRVTEFRPPQEDFSFQQQVLKEIMGGGEKIWATKMRPVELNGALSPRSSGANPLDTETSEMFGFGGR